MARRLVTKKDAKQVVQLRDQEKCTWFQIAEATGWSPMVVWQHYHRVRAYDKTRPWARRYRIGPGLRFGRLVVISTHSKKRILTSRPAQARTAGASAIAERKSFRARECESWSRWPFAGMK